jgi:hypothetical protein
MAVRKQKIVVHMKARQQKRLRTIKFSNKLKVNRAIINSGQVSIISSSRSFPFTCYGHGLPQKRREVKMSLLNHFMTY